MTKQYIDCFKAHKNIQQLSHAFKCYIISISHAPTQITFFCIQLYLIKKTQNCKFDLANKIKSLMIEKITTTIKVD
jgi:hypothetical protein